jgi:hypothetical protein
MKEKDPYLKKFLKPKFMEELPQQEIVPTQKEQNQTKEDRKTGRFIIKMMLFLPVFVWFRDFITCFPPSNLTDGDKINYTIIGVALSLFMMFYVSFATVVKTFRKAWGVQRSTAYKVFLPASIMGANSIYQYLASHQVDFIMHSLISFGILFALLLSLFHVWIDLKKTQLK